jgi:hypothetical protein
MQARLLYIEKCIHRDQPPDLRPLRIQPDRQQRRTRLIRREADPIQIRAELCGIRAHVVDGRGRVGAGFREVF